MDAIRGTNCISPLSDRLKPYVPRLAIDWLRETPSARHKQIEGSLAFVDISGFTSLTERLSRKGKVGAEEMNDLLDSCFTQLLSVAYDYGAGVIKWGGDAVLLLFTGAEHAPRACRAAAEMQRTIRAVGRIGTSSGLVRLRMSIGVHSGTFDFFFVGSLHRELLVTGAAASETVAMESLADAGEVVVSRWTARALPAQVLGVRKGAGYVLRGSPPALSERSPTVTVEGADLTRCIPVALCDHLSRGGGEAEHRPLTVAFIHFGGADEVLATEGPEGLADALERCLDAVEGVALEYKVAFFDTDVAPDGGKIMLVSGAPVATGSDEERMLRAVRAIADVRGVLPLRIGVSWGRIFVGDFGPPYRRTYSVKGDAANLAARLMATAGPGQIVVTDDVLRRSRTQFESEALEPLALKGKSEPVQAFALGAPVGSQADHHRSPLVGRGKELAALLEALESARRYEGRIVEIVGDPGIGKSRLIEELAEKAEPDSVVRVECDEYEASTPYFAVRGLLRTLLEIPDRGGDGAAAGRLRLGVKRAAPHLLPWLPLLGVPLGLELPDTPETELLEEQFRKDHVQEKTVELLGMLLLRPTVLVFEDVHWLDEASADLLARLVLTLEARPWLVVAARRDRPTSFAVPAEAHPLQIPLAPLPADAATELIVRSTEELPLPPQQVAALTARAGGNPLFLTELLAAVRRSEGLEQLPDSIEALMMHEIDDLAPADRRVLRAAAVIGATFTLDLLAASLDEPCDEGTWERLRDFITEHEGGALRFRHMLARDAAYEGLPYRRRRELHARVGKAVEARVRGNPDEEAALLSLHFFHAHQFEAAWRYSTVAATHAQSMYANVDAAVLYERALASGRQLEIGSSELAVIAEALGDVRDRAGDFRRAESAFREARRLHGRDPVGEARLLLKHAWIPERLGRYSQALRWLHRAQRVLDGIEGAEAARLRAQLHAWRAAIKNYQGRFSEGIVCCRRAIDEAERSGERDALAHAYYLLDWSYVAIGSPQKATYSPLALEIYDELGNLPRQADILNNMGAWAFLQSRWDEALGLYERGRELRERIGDPVHAANGTFNIAEIMTDQGRLEEAEPLLREALRVWRAAGWQARVALANRQLGKVAARSGNHDEGLELLERARQVFVDVGAQSDVNETVGATAECLVLQERGSEALELITPVVAKAEKSGGFELPQLKRVRSYALLQTGRLEEAGEAFDESLVTARERGAEYETALGLEGLVRLRRLRGEATDDAEAERDRILARLGVVSVLAVPAPALVA